MPTAVRGPLDVELLDDAVVLAVWAAEDWEEDDADCDDDWEDDDADCDELPPLEDALTCDALA